AEVTAVDDPVVAVEHRTGPERRQVRPGVWLAVADREVDLAAQDAGQEGGLLFFAPVLHDRRPDGVDGQEGHGRAGALRLVEEDELLDSRAALAAVLLRPADAQQAVAAQLQRQLPIGTAPGLPVRHRRLDLGRHHVCEVGTQLVAEVLLLASQGYTHPAQAPTAAVGVKRTGIALSPLMKFDRRRRGVPFSSMSGSRCSSSSNITRISSRARLAPRQK